MTSPPEAIRSYGCTFGCGNPYDVIVIMVDDGTTEFLCMPDFIRMAEIAVKAIVEPDDPEVQARLSIVNGTRGPSVPGPTAKRGRKNAPVTNTDPDIFASYDATITADELPDEFRS